MINKIKLLLLLISAPIASFSFAQSSQQPNIIFILTDDLGYSELGCYGNTFNKTPYIDKLANDGMRFTQAYSASPVCSPTRAALMTGFYPARLGITNYLGPDSPDKYLHPSCLTINEVLQNAGYTTAIIGKWHLNGDYTLKRGSPELHGWNNVICSETSDIKGGDYFSPYSFMPEVFSAGENEYLTDRLNQEAADFIRQHNKEKPFFLYLSHYAVHTRLAAPDSIIRQYSENPFAGKTHNNPVLAAMISVIDSGLGQIMEVLDEMNLTKNTIIVFTSDNGGETKVTSNNPLRDGKSFLYEGGIRVPLLVFWPGHVQVGSISDFPVITMDWFLTLASIAGVSESEIIRPHDGINLMDVWIGNNRMKRRTLFWYYPLNKPHFLGGTSSAAIRWKNYKLIKFFDRGYVELYDLDKDISESENIAEDFPRIVKKLGRRLFKWENQVTGSALSNLF